MAFVCASGKSQFALRVRGQCNASLRHCAWPESFSRCTPVCRKTNNTTLGRSFQRYSLRTPGSFHKPENQKVMASFRARVRSWARGNVIIRASCLGDVASTWRRNVVAPMRQRLSHGRGTRREVNMLLARTRASRLGCAGKSLRDRKLASHGH